MAATPKRAAGVRLLPAAMATAAALLTLKAVGMAQAATEGAAGGEHATAEAPAAEGAPAASATPTQCEAAEFADIAGLSQAEVQVLQALQARRAALDQRAATYETHDELMTAAERRLDERLTELRRLESTVADLLGQLDEAQEQRLASLVDVYQRMRAKDAAAVFDGLDNEVLIQVASRMRQTNLAEVMGRMSPARARELTQLLADRARPPTGGAELVNRARGAPAAAPTAAPAAAAGGG